MAFDSQEFKKKFHEACDQADGIKNPLVVRATARVQAGREILVGKCPVSRCGTVVALSGEGRHLCRQCGSWLRFVKDK